MKTILRMVGFTAIGCLIASAVLMAVLGVILARYSPPLYMYESARVGSREARLRVALNSEKINGVIQSVLWPVLLGTAYGLERLWHSRHRRPREWRSTRLVQWLGAIAAGLLVGMWISGVYTLVLIATLPEKYLPYLCPMSASWPISANNSMHGAQSARLFGL